MEPRPITSNETGPALFRTSQPPKKGSVREQVRLHVEPVSKVVSTLSSVLLAAWSVGLLMGGLFFLTYYWSIHFMPELDLKASVTLLAVSAITGFFFFLGLGLFLLIPVGLWVHMLRTSPLLREVWYDADGQVLRRRVFWWLCWPMGVVLVGTLGDVTLAFYGIGWEGWNGVVGLFGGILLSAGAVWCLLRRRLVDHPDRQQRRNTIVGFCVSVVVNSAFFLFSAVIVVPVFLATSYPSMPSILVIGLLWLVSFFMVIVEAEMALELSGMTDGQPLGHGLWRSPGLWVGLAIMVGLIILLGAPTAISRSMMYQYKFGVLHGVSLILDDLGCAIVNAQHVPQGLVMPYGQTCRMAVSAALPGVGLTIHSRLGSTYYVQVDRPDQSSLCFTIPAQNVLSWGIETPKKPPPARPSQSAPPLRGCTP